ncbi:hypothetical protein [Nocardioides dilutus]
MADAPDQHRRLRLRRRLLVLGLLPLLLALALCAKVGVMLALDDRGRGAFDDGHFDRAEEAFGTNGWLNVFEPWVSTFDQGTAEYRLADYPRARVLLEQALLVVPGEDECLVRTNLALTLEALGDADLVDGRRDQAEARWREGIAVLDQGACRDGAAATHRVAAARSVATRLAEKLADRAVADDATNPEDQDPPDLEELEQRNEEAQEQRRKNEETREDEPDDPDDEPDDPSTPPSYSW